MGGLGLPELAVIVTVFIVVVAIPGIAALLLFRRFARGRQESPLVASKTCGGCRQRIPDIGTFCSFCGQRQHE